MCIKGFVYCLSYDCQIDIDRDVLTTYCRSSSGGSVNSQSICATLLVDKFILPTYNIYKNSID